MQLLNKHYAMQMRTATVATATVLMLVSVLNLSAHKSAAASVQAEAASATTCKKDVRGDTVALTTTTDAEATAVQVLSGVRPAIQRQTTIGASEDYTTVATRYYEEKSTNRKTTYRCVAERVLRDGRFGEPSQQLVSWYDERGENVLTILSYYEITNSERPIVGVTALVGNLTVSLSPFDEATIGSLENWTEVDFTTLGMQFKRATKKLASGTARNFILTDYRGGEPEFVDLFTGYAIGLRQTELATTVTAAEAVEVAEHLLIKGSSDSMLRAQESRVLHHYSDLYLSPSLGWSGEHITTHTEKHYTADIFSTSRGKAVGSHVTLTEISPRTNISDFWFTNKGIIR